MRASLFTVFSVGFVLVACSGGDISIGMNDSGGPDPSTDAATGGQDGSSGQDSGNPTMDSGTGKDSAGNPDAGTDAGMCMPKIFNFYCANNLCNGGQTQYCSPQTIQHCVGTPVACKCNYTCNCLLANVPPCNQGMLNCSVGQLGELILKCL